MVSSLDVEALVAVGNTKGWRCLGGVGLGLEGGDLGIRSLGFKLLPSLCNGAMLGVSVGSGVCTCH